MPSKVFSFCNQKGGVGKTTTTINIATVLAQKGVKVLVIDMDSQANTTSGFGEEKPGIEFTSYQLFVENSDISRIIRQTAIKGLDLIPANFELAGAEIELVQRARREYVLSTHLEQISGGYDFIFMDCPPSLGLITVNCLTASDYIIIPLQCEYYALEGLGQLLNTFQLIKTNLKSGLEVGGVLMTMADLRTNLTQQVIDEVKQFFKDKVFQSIIPRSVKLSEAPSFGQPAVVYDAQNRGSKAYFLAAVEFKKRFYKKEISEPKSENKSADIQHEVSL